MTHTKVVVLTMPDNIWRILEYIEVPMRSFTINHGPENYNWTLRAYKRQQQRRS